MATTKTTKEKVVKEKKGTVAPKGTHPLILGPRITEKSALGAEKGIYTFNVARTANKNEIKKAIKMLYSVTPTKIAMVQITDNVKVRRGVLGTKSGGKKAVVYLKKGDKIAFA
jgi:large subunit ribosomal protein L23